jgi:hypothetical protein
VSRITMRLSSVVVLAASVVLVGVTQSPASIQFSVAPDADPNGAAPYAGLSTNGTGLSVLPVSPDEPQFAATSVGLGSAAAEVPLGMAFAVDGFVIGLYALDSSTTSGRWEGQFDTLAIGGKSLAMTFSSAEQLHGFGLLILGGDATGNRRLQITASEVGGQVSTAFDSWLPQAGDPPAARFFRVDTTAGLLGVAIESQAVSESSTGPIAPIPEPGSAVVWALLGTIGLVAVRWRPKR